MEPLPRGGGPLPLEGQYPPTGEDVKMQDDPLQGAAGGATGGASPITQEDEELLNEEGTGYQ